MQIKLIKTQPANYQACNYQVLGPHKIKRCLRISNWKSIFLNYFFLITDCAYKTWFSSHCPSGNEECVAESDGMFQNIQHAIERTEQSRAEERYFA